MIENEILFKNFSDEDFSHKLGGADYTFKAGSAKEMTQADANFFAKHLVDREMGKDKLQVNRPERAEYEAKCFQAISTVESFAAEPQESEPILAEVQTSWCTDCTSKGRVHKKECPKNPKKEEFEGLN